jgi:hypothetical protein
MTQQGLACCDGGQQKITIMRQWLGSGRQQKTARHQAAVPEKRVTFASGSCMKISHLHLVQDPGCAKIAHFAREQHQGPSEDEEFRTTWITHVSLPD